MIDAFTSGGAQLSGGDHSRTLQLGSDLDYVRGKHSLRTGSLLDGGWYRSDSSSNYLGTYTFNNLQAFRAESAEQLHATPRRSEHLVPESSGRCLHPGRHPAAEESDAESWSAIRSANARPATTATSDRALA